MREELGSQVDRYLPDLNVHEREHPYQRSLHMEKRIGKHTSAKKHNGDVNHSYPLPALAVVEEEPLEHEVMHQAPRATEQRELLVAEVAFALMVSMAGITHIRRAHQVSDPPVPQDKDTEDGGDRALPTVSTEGKFAEPTQALRTWSDISSGAAASLRSFSFLAQTNLQPTFSRFAFAPISSGIECDTERQSAFIDECYFWNDSEAFEGVVMNKEDSPQLRMNRWRTKRWQNLRMGRIGRTTHRIEKDDTFRDLARRYFDDANVAWLIADLNIGATQEHFIAGKRIVQVNLNQEIVLPGSEDLKGFYYKCKSIVLHPVVTLIAPQSSVASTDQQLEILCRSYSNPVTGV